MRPFFVYVLRCADGSYYVGHTDDLERRVAEHQHGSVPGHTSTRRPVALVWSDELDTREDALRREMQVKGWSRAKKEALVRGDWLELVRRSGPRTGSDLRRFASLGGVRPSTGSGRTEGPASPGRTEGPASPGRTEGPASPGRTESLASPGRTESLAGPGRTESLAGSGRTDPATDPVRPAPIPRKRTHDA